MYYIANAMNPTVWIVVGVVALLMFGGQKIPELARGLGGSLRAFKEGMNGDDEIRKESEATPRH